MRSKRIRVETGLNMRELVSGIVNANTREGRAQAEICLRLRQHLGGAVSDVEEILISDISRLHFVQVCCWQQFMRTGKLTEGSEASPLMQIYLQAGKQKAALLMKLGLKAQAQVLDVAAEAARQNADEKERAG